MKKLLGIVVLGLLLISTPSYAEWILGGTNELGDKFYFDPETIIKKSDTKYVWILTDYGVPLSDNTKSGKQLMQIDCELKRSKTHETISYTDQMGKGTPRRIGGGEWKASAPGTGYYLLLEKVCNR